MSVWVHLKKYVMNKCLTLRPKISLLNSNKSKYSLEQHNENMERCIKVFATQTHQLPCVFGWFVVVVVVSSCLLLLAWNPRYCCCCCWHLVALRLYWMFHGNSEFSLFHSLTLILILIPSHSFFLFTFPPLIRSMQRLPQWNAHLICANMRRTWYWHTST